MKSLSRLLVLGALAVTPVWASDVSILTAEREALLDAFLPRFDAVDRSEIGARAQLDALGIEMAEAWPVASPPATKSGWSCKMACSEADRAVNLLTTAKGLADAAVSGPCSSSVYAQDAAYYAGVALSYAEFGRDLACKVLPNRKDDVATLLLDARNRAYSSGSNAYYAWTVDSCDEAEDVGIFAYRGGDAAHNARTYTLGCN